MMSINRENLLKVDQRLLPDDLKGMVFLSRGVLDYAPMKDITRAIDLIQELERKCVPCMKEGITYKWLDYFQETLYHVGRMDLLKMLNMSKENMSKRLKVIGLVDAFTLLLYEIRQEVVPEDLNRIKFLYGDGSASVNAMSDTLDFFMWLERKTEIGPENVDKLEEIIGAINQKYILDKVKKYRAAHIRHESSEAESSLASSIEEGILRPPASLTAGILFPPKSRTSAHQQNFLLSMGPEELGIQNEPHDSPPEQQQQQQQQQQQPPEEEIVTSFFPEQHPEPHNPRPRPPSHAPRPQNQIGPLSEHEEMPRYKMDAVPRGYCIIINNMNFDRAGSRSPKLPPRKGTEVDRDSLKDLFTQLKFTVRVFENLSEEKMRSTVKHYSQKDHGAYDCFVMIILSHGSQEGVYGVCGRTMPLDDIKGPFKAANCATLANKPKVFIIQACQGSDPQPTVYRDRCPEPSTVVSLEHDNPGDHHPHHRPHHHNPHAPGDSLVNEADFLMAYATVPGFVSYRSPSKGSWFIMKIVEVFKKWHKRHDLLSLLTKVNDELCKSTAKVNGGHFKQTAVPVSTLRKKVYF